jgi:putative sigma-54 modulation protein
MNVKIQTHRFDADKKLLNYVNAKVDKLKTYHDSIVDVEVYLKIDNVVHQIKDKIAEIKVHIPKHTFFVKHESKQFEESFDLALKSIIDQIKSYKEKGNSIQVANIELIEIDDDELIND